MHWIALLAATALALPALAQVKVNRAPPVPPDNVQITAEITVGLISAAEHGKFTLIQQDLHSRADFHDSELAAFAAECPPMAKSDPRLSNCLSKREAVLSRIRPYNERLKAYRGEVEGALHALISALDQDIAEVQQAISRIGFGATAAAYSTWEDISKKAKEEMFDEAVDTAFTVIGSEEIARQLGEVFQKRISKRLVSPVSLNPWNVNAQIKEMERLGFTNKRLHQLMRNVASAKDKRQYVESARDLLGYTKQLYDYGKAGRDGAQAHTWQERNWALLSTSLTVLSDTEIVRPERVIKWLGTKAGEKTIGAFKASMSAANVGGHWLLLSDLTSNLADVSGLPEEQLEALTRLDARLKKLVAHRNIAKTELAKFVSWRPG